MRYFSSKYVEKLFIRLFLQLLDISDLQIKQLKGLIYAYINPILGVYSSFNDVTFFALYTFFLNYMVFQPFDFERTWWRLFQKRVVCTKFDMFGVFWWFFFAYYQKEIYSTLTMWILSKRRVIYRPDICNSSRCRPSCLALWVHCYQRFLSYSVFKSFDFYRTWWVLFQRCIVRTKLDIYVFIIFNSYF
jgi:hypothetical protein